METDTNTTHETQFVLRRLEEALRVFGKETDPHWFWVLVLAVILATGLVYVFWMYKRDSRSIGWAWAVFLALLRCTVYTILAAVFLLPAFQTWDRTEMHSKVLVVTDVSGSMGNRDDLPTDTVPVEKLPTRQDKVIAFLTDDRVGFLKKLQETNPVYAYRFGSRADAQFKLFEGGKAWATTEWADWLNPNPAEKMPEGLSDPDKKAFGDRIKLAQDLKNGTNLGSAVLDVLNRESNNMIQGIVVVTDGRSTDPSSEVFDDLRNRAKRAKVPIFTVAVGEFRQPISIRITDLQAPKQARPDDKFPIRVEVDGEGLPNRELVLSLHVTGPKGDKRVLDKPFNLNSGSGGVPHAQVEFEIDAAQMGAVPTSPGKRPELDEGEWVFQAKIPRDKREIFFGKEHESEKATVSIVKKPLRVLLFAGAPTRDYQFVRSMLVREKDLGRAEVSIYLQSYREGVVQDVEPERFLKGFPYKLGEEGGVEKPEDRYYTLAQYDLIIAFDPDWSQLQPEQLSILDKWVNQQAGGLILVAGPVNTFQLARQDNRDRVKPILDMFPVTLLDSRLQSLGIERPTTDPWRLNFPGASAELEFLKLDEDSTDALAGWEEFFTGQPKGEANKESAPVRGFYSYYPVESIKPSANVIATFSDPRAKLREGNKEQPFIVTMPYGSGKIVYLGSGEMWRLRQYREIFHERFWMKLARYAGSGNLMRLSRHGTIVMGRTFTAGQFVRLEAHLFGRDLSPLSPNTKPKIQIEPPKNVQMQTVYELEAKPTQGGEWQGWFQGRFRTPPSGPGEYRLNLQIPESGETLSERFLVKESNAELDNTRPDFGQLYQLASEVTDFMPRMEKETQQEVKQAIDGTVARLLQKVDEPEGAAPKRDATPAKKAPAADKASESKEVPRFFFDLNTAGVIPKCMVTESKVQRNRGPVKDLWDEGFDLAGNGKHRMATVLLAVTLLLSLEWLTRKLLKLA
jgi:hypothetical protein